MSDLIKEQVVEMLRMQDELNIFANGKGWKEGITDKGRDINWERCIRQELSEYIDSFNWAHWKNINGEDDIANAKMELVDVWHFLMSKFIRDNTFKPLMIVGAIKEAYRVEYSHMIREVMVQNAEDLSRLVTYHALKDSVVAFFRLCNATDLSFEELRETYVLKNSLNVFRRNNGYREGTYVKIWHGKEDNYYIQKYREDGKEITFDAITVYLTERYLGVVDRNKTSR